MAADVTLRVSKDRIEALRRQSDKGYCSGGFLSNGGGDF